MSPGVRLLLAALAAGLFGFIIGQISMAPTINASLAQTDHAIEVLTECANALKEAGPK